MTLNDLEDHLTGYCKRFYFYCLCLKTTVYIYNARSRLQRLDVIMWAVDIFLLSCLTGKTICDAERDEYQRLLSFFLSARVICVYYNVCCRTTTPVPRPPPPSLLLLLLLLLPHEYRRGTLNSDIGTTSYGALGNVPRDPDISSWTFPPLGHIHRTFPPPG